MKDDTRNQARGILATFALSGLVLYIFFGNLLPVLNRVSFATGGDGMQSYINMEYHIRYDTSFMHCLSMNYPFGEHVFFTNNQPPLSNSLKYLSRIFPSLPNYTLGILNAIMLGSLLLAPVFLYLILTGLGTGTIFSSMASLGIAYLSPQIDRLGGHFNLSYVCLLPLAIWLMILFFKKPGWGLSVAICILVFAGALIHFYFYGFFAVLLLFFYLAYAGKWTALFGKSRLGWIHLVLQLVLPFVVLQLFYISDQVTDRPGYPWGFLYYRAYPQSILLPLGKPYGQFLHSFVKTNHINWEGFAYIGTMALAGFAVLLVRGVRRLLSGNRTAAFIPTDNRQLNILFWASVAALLYSFGLPFILGLEWLVDLIGPVRQMRGIARFSWIFFYVINVLTAYMIWQYLKKTCFSTRSMVVALLALAILGYDSWHNVRGRGNWLMNFNEALTDRELKEPENQWIRRLDLSRYQSLIPIPYFHVGSENIWMEEDCGILTQSFIAAKQSGLPTMGVMLSRTSISQTLHNLALMYGAPARSVDMAAFPNQKPFLILAARCDKLTWFEQELIRHSHWVDSSGVFDLYEAPFALFTNISDSLSKQALKKYAEAGAAPGNSLRITPNSQPIFISFDSLKNETALAGNGCFEGRAGDYLLLFDGAVAGADSAHPLRVSLWLNHLNKDRYARSLMILTELDSTGRAIREEIHQVFRFFEQISGNWALVEIPYTLSENGNRLAVRLRNPMLRKQILQADNLLIRHESDTVFYSAGGNIWVNNRLRCQ